MANLVDVVVVAGGATRQQSVANGLQWVESTRVVIHDAARPFATAQAVLKVLDALENADAAVTAVPVDETLKKVDAGVVVGTIERTGLYRVQTPQAFRTPVLKRGHDQARSEGFEATDDAQLIERWGGTVAVVQGSRANIKITFAEDFKMAESMLEAHS